MEFVNKDDTESVCVMHLSSCFDENLGDMYRAGNCGTLHYDVSRLRDEVSKLKLKIQIIRVGK